MKNTWVGPSLQIATIFAFRMLGLFMLIPIFTLYAQNLQGVTHYLLGIALGGYGLTQGLLQIPFGILSDRYGRKPLIILGLILFATGSLIGALTHSIYGMILARILQGGGAIGSVLIALLADITPDEHRSKAMAMVGAVIGLSFSLAFIVSPTLAAATGLAGIFYLTAGLSFIGLGMLYFIPSPKLSAEKPIIEPKHLKTVLLDNDLLFLDLGIFFQHFILVASFYVLPMMIQDYVRMGILNHAWHFYLIVIVGAFLVMIPIMLYGEKYNKVKLGFLSAIAVITATQCMLIRSQHSLLGLGIILFLYFIAFNFLEAQLPSLISKQAKPHNKGTALGVYSTSQFLGIFAGGILAGLMYTYAGAAGIFKLNTAVALIWLYLSGRIKI